MKLAANAIRDVNKQPDEHGMTYARTAMIRCRLSKQGLWDVRQLFPHQEIIVNNFRENFDGLDADDKH